MLINQMRNLLEDTEYQVREIQKTISNMPEGRLIIAKNGQYHRFFRVIEERRETISSKDKNSLNALARKTYYLLKLNDLINEKIVLESGVKSLEQCTPMADVFLNEAAQAGVLERTSFHDYSDVEWLRDDYPKNISYPEYLIHRSVSGNTLRSKSEAMIDMALYLADIPYRYECQMVIGKNILYPDFTILHPATRETIIWEHFGKMDDPAYAANVFRKLQLYYSAGYVPGVNFILTFETKEKPITAETIDKIIQESF